MSEIYPRFGKRPWLDGWTDQQFRTFPDLRDALFREEGKQVAKWGVQTRPPFEWLAYLTEEIGELAEAISEAVYRDGGRAEVSYEAIQVATLALKIAEMAQEE